MHVDLGKAGRRPSRSPRFYARDRTEAPSSKERKKTGIETVPRRSQNRERAGPEKRDEPRSARRQIGCHGATRARRRELALLAVGSMTCVAPTVLQDGETRPLERSRGAAKPRRKSRIGRGWNDGERNRDVAGNRNEAVEPTARRHRIIVTPPEGCDLSRVSPPVELVDQIGPSHSCRRIFAGQTPHLAIIPRTGRDTKFLFARLVTLAGAPIIFTIKSAVRCAPPVSTEIVLGARSIARSMA